MAGSSSAQGPSRRHISGLWIGTATPDPQFASDTPDNPIVWSLTLLEPAPVLQGPPQSAAPSLFGSGYFDDAGDIPNETVLFFSLRGTWDPGSNHVSFVKVYENVTADLRVVYTGKVTESGPDGQPVLSGVWRNELEGTSGTFACRLEECDKIGFHDADGA